MKFVINCQVEKSCPYHPAERMIVKENRNTGHQFLGCPLWPDCDYTEEIPQSMIMKAAGAQTLPGFEDLTQG